MTPSCSSRPARGFTLVELLVVLGIITLLAALIFVNLGPARERGKETRCISNLRQIGQAVQMYRQDYEGQDPPAALTAEQLGLPTVPPNVRLLSYLPEQDVWRCLSEYWPDVTDYEMAFDYIWCANSDADNARFFPNEKPGQSARFFSYQVARRGMDVPILFDPHHGTYQRPSQNASEPFSILVLRLSGQVQRVQTANREGWQW